MQKNNDKKKVKFKGANKPSADNDQMGENASGYPGQNEQYKKDKSK